MAKPASRQELVAYCKRKLGAPVLEINVADEQIEDLVDDAIQFFQERHFDGVAQTILKYEITQEDIDRARGRTGEGETSKVGLAKTYVYKENSNYIEIPDHVIGINKVFKLFGGNSLGYGMFNFKYQLFLNDIYYWGSTDILTYFMTKRYLEDLDWILSPDTMIRFNKRDTKLYIDIDWGTVSPGNILLIDCYRALDPTDSTKVWNDSFLKQYLTSLIKRQWGQNLIKFRGVKLPGGVELNGREIYEDAQREIDMLMEKMSSTYEEPVFDIVG
jgi:hypothetical protein